MPAFLEGNWLVGVWTLDREKTMEFFVTHNQRENPRGGLVGEFAASAIRNSVDALVKNLDGVRVIISDEEILEAGNTLAKAPRSYEIVSRAENQIKIVDSEDDVRVYHREGDNIWYFLDKNETFRVYLKPAPEQP